MSDKTEYFNINVDVHQLLDIMELVDSAINDEFDSYEFIISKLYSQKHELDFDTINECAKESSDVRDRIRKLSYLHDKLLSYYKLSDDYNS